MSNCLVKSIVPSLARHVGEFLVSKSFAATAFCSPGRGVPLSLELVFGCKKNLVSFLTEMQKTGSGAWEHT